MINYCICIDMMFAEIPFSERIEAVADYGFKAIEFWRWSNKDLKDIKQKTKKHGIDIAIINLDNKDKEISDTLWQGALSCKNKDLFMESVKQTIEVCDMLNVKRALVLPGNKQDSVSIEKQRELLVSILVEAAQIADSAGITLVLEPINTFSRPKTFLSCSKDGFKILGEIGSDSVKLLYDVYHQQQMEGNIINTIKGNINQIGHIQIADVPGRHEPGTGEINYPNVLASIESTGYKNYVGLEYVPTSNTRDSLKFIE